MWVGVLEVTLAVVAFSLKEKRGTVKRILARTRQKFHVAGAEVDFQDNMDGAVLGFALGKLMVFPDSNAAGIVWMRRMLQRAPGHRFQRAADAAWALRGLSLDRRARTVQVDGREVQLTGAEFDILRALVERAGRVVSRERLMELARGEEFGAFDRAIDMHISNIRKKLGDSARNPRWIRTIRGVGYQVPVPRAQS